MGAIADFAVKPFSSKQISKHLKWLKLFSALSGLVWPFERKLENNDFSRTIARKDKDKGQAQGQGLEIGL